MDGLMRDLSRIYGYQEKRNMKYSKMAFNRMLGDFGVYLYDGLSIGMLFSLLYITNFPAWIAFIIASGIVLVPYANNAEIAVLIVCFTFPDELLISEGLAIVASISLLIKLFELFINLICAIVCAAKNRKKRKAAPESSAAV